MSNPIQKRAILSLSYSSLRVTELTLLTVEDVMTKSGKIKEEIYLRALITKGCRPRSVWFSNRTRKLVSEYIEYRIEKRIGVSTTSKAYCGLNPMSKLICSSKGVPYSLKVKPRVSVDGIKRTYLSNDTVEALIRSIYSRCGLFGASSHIKGNLLNCYMPVKGSKISPSKDVTLSQFIAAVGEP